MASLQILGAMLLVGLTIVDKALSVRLKMRELGNRAPQVGEADVSARKNGAAPKQRDPEPAEAERPKRNLGAYIDADVDAEMRAAIYDLRRRIDPDEFNISRFVHEALRAHLIRYRRLYNNGQPWPTSGHPRTPVGRPMKKTG